MTLSEYLQHLGWNLSDLCRNAHIEMHTARRAVKEGVISARTARKLADCLSKAMGQEIKPGDIRGLTIRN